MACWVMLSWHMVCLVLLFGVLLAGGYGMIDELGFGESVRLLVGCLSKGGEGVRSRLWGGGGDRVTYVSSLICVIFVMGLWRKQQSFVAFFSRVCFHVVVVFFVCLSDGDWATKWFKVPLSRSKERSTMSALLMLNFSAGACT